MKYKRVLVASGHTDDGGYGAGATIARLAEEGSEIQYIAFSAPEQISKEECMASTKSLGVSKTTVLNLPRWLLPEHRQKILQTFVDIDAEFNPDLVLVPSTRDVHQDHEVISREASRGIFRDSTILGYEIPHNIRDWNYVSQVTADHVKRKIFCLSKYQSQMNRFYFDPDFIRSWARFRGGVVNVGYGEAFEVIKILE